MSRPPTARLSLRCRILVPAIIRERLGIGPGDLIAFENLADGIVIRAVRAVAPDGPFVAFDEWSGAADEAAYAELSVDRS
jgi:AbrB family looped-hinge helix DNA binding protein